MQGEEIIEQVFEKLNENFVCIHINGTKGPLQPWLDGNFPRVFECSFVRKDLIETMEIEPGTFPIAGLDYATDISRPDLRLDYWHTIN